MKTHECCALYVTVLAAASTCVFGRLAFDFDGYKVLNVEVKTRATWAGLVNFMSRADDEFDVWHWPEGLGDSLQVLLSPSQIQAWSNTCASRSLLCTYIINDIQKLLDVERHTSLANSVHNGGRYRRDTDFPEVLHRLSGFYPTWRQIEKWLLDLNRTENIVNVMTIGRTHEGRHLYVVQIKAPSTPLDAPAIFIDTGIHAREWIAHSSGIYIIAQLVERYYQDTKIRPLVEGLVWYVMPVVNPDGYVYSHETYRFWRKNRSPPPPGVTDGYKNSTCIGVDLNRNWGFHWGEVGVSTNSCSIIYPGHEAMSELETKATSQFMSSRPNLHGYVNIHSYGQLFLTRYGYTNVTPVDHPELLNLSTNIAEVISGVHNVTYLSGISPDILYPYSGGVADWAKGSANIKFSFSTELRDLGTFGFVLPANFVIPVGEEIFAGLMKMGDHILQRAISLSESSSDSETTSYAPVSDDPTLSGTSGDGTTSHTTRKTVRFSNSPKINPCQISWILSLTVAVMTLSWTPE